ncbi:hypothetical protein OROGR_022327 [Orobanche gracilis]
MTRKGKEAAGSSSKAPARKVQNPGCIKERLFKVEDFEGVPDLLIPAVAFMTVLLSFGWRKFISDLPCGNPLIVLNFFQNFNRACVDEKSPSYNTTTVNGKKIRFSPTVINNFLGIDSTDTVPIPTTQNSGVTDDDVLKWALREEEHTWIGTNTPRYDQASLTKEAWYMWMWAAGSIYPTSTLTTISISHLRGLYKIYHGAKLDIGEHIYNIICHYASTMPTRNKMPYPCIITGLCYSQKVHSPPGGDMLIHSDLLTDKSFGLRTVQLRSKRGRVELEDNQDEERPEGSSSAPPVVGRNPFERQILERLQKIEDTQGVILANQDKTAKAFAKLFRHLNLPDDDE